jgi:hypothetical protein
VTVTTEVQEELFIKMGIGEPHVTLSAMKMFYASCLSAVWLSLRCALVMNEHNSTVLYSWYNMLK